jgi:hypothetical protein
MDETEYNSIRELYDTVAGPDSVSYEVFVKKLRRLQEGNTRTANRLSRNLSVEPPKAPVVRKTPRKPSPKKPKKPSDFIAYDGEGWSDKYVLLANSLGERIVNQDGLSTKACLEFLTQKYDHVVKRIFFSFGYDVNHIIKDFTDEQITQLLKGESVHYEGYRVSYIPGKIFIVNGYRYYDCFSFFATSFINVVKQMLGPERVTADLIEGKSGRGTFESWDLDKIIKYNDEELALMVEILEKLRKAFRDINVNLTEWYGPGAVAKFWFKAYEVAPKESHTVGSIAALNSAYYGGRFEQIVLGKVRNIYEYDIHSAYPSAMVDMPYFRTWRQVKRNAFKTANKFSIWHVTFDLRSSKLDFGPLPIRSKDGRICYPLVGKGWYWYDEIRVLLDFFPTAKVQIHEGYVAKTEGTPFDWIELLYDYRMKLKGTGNLSQYAIKVGLNSLYGKCAQRVGRNPYFSLSWAGYITASTRAKLARAAYEAGSSHILGFATDALFSDRKLPIPISPHLGDWEESSYQFGTFFQSGVYRLVSHDGSVQDRYRGSPLRRGIDDVIKQLQQHPSRYPRVKIARFISNLLAIKAPEAYGPHRNKFVQVVYEIKIDAPYKRHYDGLTTFKIVDGKPTVQHNFRKLLTQPITSDPKVFAGDNVSLMSDYYLYGKLQPTDIESQPPPMKDANTQRLLDEANLLGVEEGYDEVAKVELLPVVEDEMT